LQVILKYCCAEANLTQAVISVGRQLLSYPFVVYTRDGWLERRLAAGQPERVTALSAHACFGRSAELRVGAATLIRPGDTNTSAWQWPPSTFLTE